MGFKVPKDVPEWMRPDRHIVEKIEQAAKLQRQIDEVTGAATFRMLSDLNEREQKAHYQFEKAFRSAIGGELLRYSNTILDHLQRSRRAQNAIDMVGLFSDPNADVDALQDWIDGHRDSLTVEDLQTIIMAAMAHGVGEAMSEKQAKLKDARIETDDEIRRLWERYKGKGMSKNAATDRIAYEVGQTPQTVRRKLKGL